MSTTSGEQVPVETAAFIAALPKAELHLHLVGSASVDTVLALARRHPEHGVPTDAARLAEFYRFTDFTHFIRVIKAVDELVITAQDVHTLVLGLAADAARSGVRYAEVTVTVSLHLAKGIPATELADTLAAARAQARLLHHITLNYIYDIPAGFGGQQAVDATVDFALHHRPEGTVALGLAGMEDGYPRAGFAGPFADARAAGLHVVAHAGETTGPEEVWAALTELGAERIGHGIGSVGDPALLRYLAEHRVPLEVCPISNVRTRATPSLAEHPLPRLLAAGIPVALSTDDPGMFDTDLNREYRTAAQLAGLDHAGIAGLARNSVDAAFCTEQERTELLATIDAAVGASRRSRRLPPGDPH